MEQVKEKPTTPPKEETGQMDDFFNADSSREDELSDFISHMRTPRETVEIPGMETDTEGGESLSDGEEWTPDDEEMLSSFDYTPEHKYTAEFLLIQLDKAIAFSLSMVSGAQSEKYRKRLVKPTGEDYEAEILAALLKKYQMRMSLEWMFASALMIAYAPMVDLAIKDRRENVRKKQEEARRQYAEMLKREGIVKTEKEA